MRSPLLRLVRARRTAARHRLALDLDDCRRQLARWQRHADSYERELSHLSRERAHLLAWLAALHPSSAVITPATEAGPGGTHLLRLVAGERLLTWRLPPADLPLFTHVRHAESPRRDGPRIPDQSAHIRHHTHLLALEEALSTTPPPPDPP